MIESSTTRTAWGWVFMFSRAFCFIANFAWNEDTDMPKLSLIIWMSTRGRFGSSLRANRVGIRGGGLCNTYGWCSLSKWPCDVETAATRPQEVSRPWVWWVTDHSTMYQTSSMWERQRWHEPCLLYWIISWLCALEGSIPNSRGSSDLILGQISCDPFQRISAWQGQTPEIEILLLTSTQKP